MHERTLARAAMALGATAVVVAFVLSFALLVESVMFALAFAAAYGAGVAAYLLQPDNRAARRLFAFGVIAIVWDAASLLVILAYDRHGDGSWFAVANTAVQM